MCVCGVILWVCSKPKMYDRDQMISIFKETKADEVEAGKRGNAENASQNKAHEHGSSEAPALFLPPVAPRRCRGRRWLKPARLQTQLCRRKTHGVASGLLSGGSLGISSSSIFQME